MQARDVRQDALPRLDDLIGNRIQARVNAPNGQVWDAQQLIPKASIAPPVEGETHALGRGEGKEVRLWYGSDGVLALSDEIELREQQTQKDQARHIQLVSARDLLLFQQRVIDQP
jgi:hypothetical protein